MPSDKRPWLRQFRFPKGRSGNPGGRPKSQSANRAAMARLAYVEISAKDVKELGFPKNLVGKTWAQASAAILSAYINKEYPLRVTVIQEPPKVPKDE